MSYKFLSTIQAISATFTGNSVYSNSTPNRTVKLDATGLYISRISDGGYASTITADGSMYYNTRNNHIFQGDSSTKLTIVQASGNVLIGTTTDGSYKLDVNGTARINSTLTLTSSTYAGTFSFYLSAANTLIGNSSNIGNWLQVGGGNRVYITGQEFNSTSRGNIFGNTVGGEAISATTIIAQSSGTTATTGLSLRYTINNTGTYVGISRGIYYNPTITSLTGTTHRAIETVTGDVIFGSTSGNVGIGTTAPGGKLQVNGSVTASGAVARGTYITNTLVAAANNDVLVGLDITPTFTNGAFTGVSNIGLRVKDNNSGFDQIVTTRTLVTIGNTSNQSINAVNTLILSLPKTSGGGLIVQSNNSSTFGLTESPFINFNNVNGQTFARLNAVGTNGNLGRLEIGVAQPSTTISSGAFFYAAANRGTTQFALGSDFTDNSRAVIVSHWDGASALILKPNASTTTAPTLRVRNNADSGDNFLVYGATGNVGINVSSDAGYKLDVNGTARVITSLQVGNFTPGVAAASSTIFTTGRISASGGITFYNPSAGDNQDTGFKAGGYGVQIYISNGTVGSFGGYGSSTDPMLNLTSGFNPNSGSTNKTILLLNSTYQVSGTYSGGITGFLYNPSLTSITGIAYHRAIHTVTGDVLFGTTSGVVGIGTSTLSTEANLYLGAKSTIEGGQLVLQKGTSQTYATHLDNYNNQFRVMVGTDTGSTAAQLIVMHATGNVLINSGTDNGYKFQVAGNVNVNTGSNTNNLVVNADTTMFYNLTSGGGQVQSNVYTTSVTTKYTANGSSSVALFEWDPTLCQGVFVDYVVLVDGINRLRSGTLVIVNDNGGNVTITDNINSSVNGSSSAVTFTTAGVASIRLYCNNGYAANDVFVNIVTRYIPNIY